MRQVDEAMMAMGRRQAGDPAYLGQLVPMMLDEYLAALTPPPPA